MKPTPKYMKLSQYSKTYFADGSQPDTRTLQRLIDNGELAGRRLGTQYYVDIAVEQASTGDSLVDAVLRAS